MSLPFPQIASPCRLAVGFRAPGRWRAVHWLGRWLRLLLCQVLPVWCVMVLGAGSASAMVGAGPADEPAPMCDPDGASVAAGEDIPEMDRGRFEALPCEAQLLLAGWRPDARELGCKALSSSDSDPAAPLHSAQSPRGRCEATCVVSVIIPRRAEPMAAVFSVGEGLSPRRGHARTPFRPPLTRG
jgi:hypothetical protein